MGLLRQQQTAEHLTRYLHVGTLLLPSRMVELRSVSFQTSSDEHYSVVDVDYRTVFHK